ncbi:MAG: hypothetical protein WC595_02430 [Candidatus Nanoarchaeia archaeon]
MINQEYPPPTSNCPYCNKLVSNVDEHVEKSHLHSDPQGLPSV